jgi:hypothetical protein
VGGEEDMQWIAMYQQCIASYYMMVVIPNSSSVVEGLDSIDNSTAREVSRC